MKNKRMFVIKYLSATNHKGTRFRITDTRHKGNSKIYSWNYKYNGLLDQATKILNDKGINVDGYSEPWTEMDKVYIFSNNFNCQI